MEEKILEEVAHTLREIKMKLDKGYISEVRGPVADPMPPWTHRFADPVPPWMQFELPDIYRRYPGWGREGDPVPELVLDKARIARLTISRLDAVIEGFQKQIELNKLKQDLLKEEYGL